MDNFLVEIAENSTYNSGMATMFPAELPKEAEVSYAERKVFSALQKQLPDKYRVYHSFHWTENTNVPREADFIIVNPEKGFIVLEVKGGEISVLNNTWYTSNRHSRDRIDNPFEQARRSLYFLLEHFKQHKNSRFLGLASFGVFFPDTSSDASYMHPEMTEHNTFFNQNLDNISECIERLFINTAYGTGDIENNHIDEFCRMLTPSLHMHMSIRAAIDRQQEEIDKLNYFQDYLLDVLEDKRRAAFQGTAGTGKTWIAVKKAVRLVKQGKRCLLLCFNKELKLKLAEIAKNMLEHKFSQEETEEYFKRLSVYNFHGYANHVFKEYLEFLLDDDALQKDIFTDITKRIYPNSNIKRPADLIGLLASRTEKAAQVSIIEEYDNIDKRLRRFLESILDDSSEDFFGVNVPAALLRILEDETYEADQYDAIIIDEAQDFKKSWCDCLERLIENKRKRIVYIFYDNNQNIFCTRGQLPIIDLIDKYNVSPYLYNLRRNIRNTRAIHDYAIEATSLGKTSEAIDIEGIRPVVTEVSSEGEARQKTGSILHELIEKHKIENNRIIVLTDRSVGKSVFAEDKQAGVFKLTDRGKGETGNYVRIRSVRQFKGLESDVVIFIEHGQDNDHDNREELLYVAYTRAKFLLHVIRLNR